jgi:RNA-binding protein 25
VRDRQQEEDERKALDQESEDFLTRQMAEMAEMEEKQRRAGMLFDDAAPVKLAINALPTAKEEKKPELAAVALEGDDEDDETIAKKKRTLVKLEYGGDGLTEAEKLAKRNARLLEIRSRIPSDKRKLWESRIEWPSINQVRLSTS